MTKYSLDLRQRVVKHAMSGNTRISTSKLYSVGLDTVYRWLKLYKSGSSLAGSVPRRSPHKLDHDEISDYILSNPDYTLKEIAIKFNTHQSVIWYICKKYNITRKKNYAVSRARSKKA